MKLTPVRTRGQSAEMATILSNCFELKSCICGHHICKNIWTPVVDEEMSCRREKGNVSDSYTVAFIKYDVIVGHVPLQISAAYNLFVLRGGAVVCKVTGPGVIPVICLKTD